MLDEKLVVEVKVVDVSEVVLVVADVVNVVSVNVV